MNTMPDAETATKTRPSEGPAGAEMPSLASISLRGKTVTIGPVTPNDTGALFLWLNDVESSNLDLAFRPVDWMSYNTWLGDFAANSSRVLFAIRAISNPKIIGFVMLKNIQPIHRWAELGIRIGNAADRGKGYGREATELVLKYAWNQLNLNRVQLSVFANNERAIRAYLAAGFSIEGVQRQAVFIDGNWLDQVLMGVLRPARPHLRSVTPDDGNPA